MKNELKTYTEQKDALLRAAIMEHPVTAIVRLMDSEFHVDGPEYRQRIGIVSHVDLHKGYATFRLRSAQYRNVRISDVIALTTL